MKVPDRLDASSDDMCRILRVHCILLPAEVCKAGVHTLVDVRKLEKVS